MKGRKRFLLVDTQGWVIETVVLPAGTPERIGAAILFERAKRRLAAAKLQLVWADGGFAGQEWQAQMQEQFGWQVEIVAKLEGQQGFVVLPRRWPVERTFGWWGHYRRLSKDYEGDPASSRAWLLWAMVDKMLCRLFPKTDYPPFRYRSV